MWDLPKCHTNHPIIQPLACHISHTHTCIYIYIYLSIDLSIYLSIYPSFHLFIYPSIHLSIYPSIFPPICLSIFLSIYLSIYPSTYLSICLSVCLSIYLSFFLYLISFCRFFFISKTALPLQLGQCHDLQPDGDRGGVFFDGRGGAFPWKRRLNPSESRFLSGT